jgi:hypothetical protein
MGDYDWIGNNLWRMSVRRRSIVRGVSTGLLLYSAAPIGAAHRFNAYI